MSSPDLDSISLMSAPAANARSDPVSDDRADPLVGVEGGCRGHDVPHDLRVEGVERLGPVQGDPADAAARLDQDRLVRRHCSRSCVAIWQARIRLAALSARIVLMIPEKSCPAPAPSANSL